MKTQALAELDWWAQLRMGLLVYSGRILMRIIVTNGSKEKWRLETKVNVVKKRSIGKPEDRKSHHQEVELFASVGAGSPAWTSLPIPSF